MRILLVASELPPVTSGVAQTCLRLVEGYRRAGAEVETWDRGRTPSLHLGELRLSALPFTWRRVLPKVRWADVIHLHGPAPSFADTFLLRLGGHGRRVPVVYTHHFEIDLPGLGWACRLYSRGHARLAERRADRVVLSTGAYRDLYRDPSRLTVIPWGADHQPVPEPSPERGRGPLRVLFVGQMRAYKGLPVLLEALRRVEGIELTAVGSGPLLDEYRRLAERLGSAAVHLPGRVDDGELERLRAGADVVVLPSTSRLEAFGMVLVEGMRAGCVPVASALPGVSEVVGEAGLTPPPGDAEALRRSLLTLRDDRALVRRLSAAARERADRFRWQTTVADYLELFADLTAT